MKTNALLLLFFVGIIPLFAQEESAPKPVLKTFLGTKAVNGQSTELPGNGELNLMINHRFGALNGGAYEFWGLDQAEIRIGFDYGITDYLSATIARNSYQKTYETSLKFKPLAQKENGMPVTVTGFLSGYYNTLKDIYPSDKDNFSGRFSYIGQLAIARKFSMWASAMLSAGIMHENYNLIEQDAYNIPHFGGAVRIKVLSRVHINAEYYYLANKLTDTYDPFSIGIDLDTGGHLFQLLFSNTQTTFEKSLLSDTRGQWSKGDVYFGFNLIRVFYLK